MRRLLATMPTCVPALAPALLAFFMTPISSEVARSDPSGLDAAAPVTPAALTCTANDVVVYESDPSSGSEPGCTTAGRTPAEVAEARAYVIETASPGFTMTLQGAELAIGRLHPEFVVRLANAIREARSAKGRTTLARLTVGRVAGKSARHGKQVVGIGVGGPIIAAEEGQRKSSTKQAKHGTRIVIGPTKITVIEKEDRKSSARQAKHDTRVSARGTGVIAEESRRKPKSGRG